MLPNKKEDATDKESKNSQRIPSITESGLIK